MSNGKTAALTVDGKTIQLPMMTGTENETAIDIANLRKETGAITLDHGFMNTGSCTSAITFLDGEQGILRYRGIPIEQLAERSNFIEVAYLLIYGKLPAKTELDAFSTEITKHSMIHPNRRDSIVFLRCQPRLLRDKNFARVRCSCCF